MQGHPKVQNLFTRNHSCQCSGRPIVILQDREIGIDFLCVREEKALHNYAALQFVCGVCCHFPANRVFVFLCQVELSCNKKSVLINLCLKDFTDRQVFIVVVIITWTKKCGPTICSETCSVRLIFLLTFFLCPHNYYNDNNMTLQSLSESFAVERENFMQINVYH